MGSFICLFATTLIWRFFFYLFFHFYHDFRSFYLIFEVLQLIWENVSNRCKVIVVREFLAHQCEVFREFVLVCYYLNSGPLGQSLVWLDPIQDVRSNRQVEPAYVELIGLIVHGVVVLVG